jgi:hypothetical protein
MSGRREAEHEDAGARITEPGNATTLVDVVAIRRPLVDRDLLAPRDEARALPARSHVGGEPSE